MPLLQSAIESSAFSLIVIDTKGIIVDVNETTVELFAYTKAELVGAPVDMLIPLESRGKHRHHISDFFKTPIQGLMGDGRTILGMRKDGSTFAVDARISSFEKDGKQYGVANLLRSTREPQMPGLLAATQFIARIGSWRVNLTTNKAIWSKMVYDIHEVDESVEIDVAQGINFYVEEHRPIITQCINKCIENLEPWDVELKIVTTSGKEKWVHAIGSAIVDAEKKVVGLEGTFRDIHEHKLILLEREAILEKLKQTEILSSIGNWEWQLTPEKIEWSNGLYDIAELDLTRPALSLDQYRDYLLLEDQELFYATLNQAVRQQDTFSLSFRIKVNQRIKHIQLFGSPQFDTNGKLTGFFGSAQDISARKAEEANSDILNKRLLLALAASNMGVWELDLLTDELTWDKKMMALYGIAEEDFSGAYDAWTRGLHPDDRAESERLIEKAINGEEQFQTNFRVVWPDKTVRDIRALADVVTDGFGKPLKMIGVNWDITEENRQKKMLETSNERYELMARGSSVGIWDWPDINEKEEYWSEKFYSLLGYTEQDIEPSLDNFAALLHPQDSEQTLAALDLHLSKDTPFDLPYRLKTKSGSYRWFRGTGRASRDSTGKPVRMVGSIQDIHEQILAKTNLEKMNDELMQISYRTSHDLKGPLTTSKRLAEYIVKDIESGDSEEAAKNALRISKQMERLEGLVSDILELARAELHTESVEAIDFKQLETKVTSHLAWMIQDSHCQIEFSDQLSSVVYGEQSRYIQIIENLVSNGIKYRNTKRKKMLVNVTIRDEKESIVLTVSDNGIGIPTNNQDEIFTMFKRFHPSVASGSGLGLSIVKKHVDFLNGDISVNSSAEGTQFNVTLPKLSGDSQ